MPPETQPSFLKHRTRPELAVPEETVVLTVDAEGVPRAIGDLTDSLPSSAAGVLRAVEYTSVSDALAEARTDVHLLELHTDVVREALARLRPIIRAVRAGEMAFDELLDTVDHIRAMKPEDLQRHPQGLPLEEDE